MKLSFPTIHCNVFKQREMVCVHQSKKRYYIILQQQFVIFETWKPSNFCNFCFYRFPAGRSAPTLKTACFNFITLTFLIYSVVLFTQFECKSRQFQDVHWRARIKMSQRRTGAVKKRLYLTPELFIRILTIFFFSNIFFFWKLYLKKIWFFFFLIFFCPQIIFFSENSN